MEARSKLLSRVVTYKVVPKIVPLENLVGQLEHESVFRLQRQELLGPSVAQRHLAALSKSTQFPKATVVAGGTSANVAHVIDISLQDLLDSIESSSSGTTPRIARRTVSRMDFARSFFAMASAVLSTK